MPKPGLNPAAKEKKDDSILIKVGPADVVEAFESLEQTVQGVNGREEAIVRIISIMYQAIGQRIVLIEDNGDEYELQSVWSPE